MIVSFTGLTRKVLLTGNEKKFVIAIMHIVQTSYRVTTNISENLCQEFITYCSTNDNEDLFCFFKEKHGEFRTGIEFVHSWRISDL